MRTPDRRRQLLQSSARLFYARGFHEVTVADVARDLGLSAGAVYRYVPDKMSMLVGSIQEMVTDWSAATVAVADVGGSPAEVLERVARAAVMCAVDRADVVGLWHREAAVIPTAASREMVEIRGKTIAVSSEALAGSKPKLTSAELEFRIRTALGILNAVPELRSFARARQIEILTAAMVRALVSRPAAKRVVLDINWPPTCDKERRSAVIAREAARLFREHGYGSVGMDEIGAASGVAGPSIYKHFTSKQHLLASLLLPIAGEIEAQAGELSTGNRADQLTAFVARRVQFALGRRDLVAIYATESKHLDPPQRKDIEHSHAFERSRLAALIKVARPTLSAAESKMFAAACLAMIDSVARSQRHTADVEVARVTVGMTVAAAKG